MSRSFGPLELLDCYARGVFPMGEAADDPRLFLVDPDIRGILPLDEVHVPRRLRRTVRAETFSIRINTAFSEVMEACAEPADGRRETWINAPILNLYSSLHRMGHAHSVECWRDGELVGGLYGVSLKGAFFGESMFSRERDASKVALVHLVARVIQGGYRLLDTQFTTSHLEQFGVQEVERDAFKVMLANALSVEADFVQDGAALSGQAVLQLITQTS